MKVSVDLEACRGNGQCADAAPSVFRVTDEGLCELLQVWPPDEIYPLVQDAARRCPQEAITFIR